MSIIPIGTVFPAVAPSALVRVGIPTGDGFYMNEGSIPLESIIPSSGTWTPVVSNITGGGTVTVQGSAFYQKIGDIVMCSFRIKMIPDTGANSERFDLTLPIEPTANFAANNLVNGAITMVGNFPDIDQCNIKSATGAKQLDITISTIQNDVEVDISIHVQYSI
jgi:hypothetical protein